MFGHANGSCIDSDGSVYCTDNIHHTICKFTPKGELLMILGNECQHSDTGFTLRHGERRTTYLDTVKHGGPLFNGPTGVAVFSSGDIFVSDSEYNTKVKVI